MRKRHHHKPTPAKLPTPVAAVVVAVALFVSAFQTEMKIVDRYAAVAADIRTT